MKKRKRKERKRERKFPLESCLFDRPSAPHYDSGQFLGSSGNAKIEARTSHKSITRERSSRIWRSFSRLARQNWPVFAGSWNCAAFIVAWIPPPQPTSRRVCIIYSGDVWARVILRLELTASVYREQIGAIIGAARMNCTRGRDFQAAQLLFHSALVLAPITNGSANGSFVRSL